MSHLGGGLESGEVLEVLVDDLELLGGEGLLLEHLVDRGVGDALHDLAGDVGVHAGEAGVDTDVGVVDVNDVRATDCRVNDVVMTMQYMVERGRSASARTAWTDACSFMRPPSLISIAIRLISQLKRKLDDLYHSSRGDGYHRPSALNARPWK